MPLRLLRAALVTLVAATVLVVLPSGPASACSCVGGDARDFVDWADLVVAGTVADRDVSGGFLGRGGDTATYTVEVDRVYEGDATQTMEISSSAGGASCGLEYVEEGGRYVVFADRRRDGEHWASLCGGTAPASDRLVAQVEQLLGPGDAPTPGGPEPTPDLPGWPEVVQVVGLIGAVGASLPVFLWSALG